MNSNGVHVEKLAFGIHLRFIGVSRVILKRRNNRKNRFEKNIFD